MLRIIFQTVANININKHFLDNVKEHYRLTDLHYTDVFQLLLAKVKVYHITLLIKNNLYSKEQIGVLRNQEISYVIFVKKLPRK